MNNILGIQNNSWNKYSAAIATTDTIDAYTHTSDTITVVDSLTDIGIKKEDGKLVPYIFQNATSMQMGAKAYEEWNWSTDFISGSDNTYYLLRGSTWQGSGYIIAEYIYKYWNEYNARYELTAGIGSVTGDYTTLVGHVTYIGNDSTPGTAIYGVITDNTVFSTSGSRVIVRNFYKINFPTNSGNTVQLYDAAKASYISSAAGTKQNMKTYLADQVSPHSIKGYVYHNLSYFNSESCKGKYVYSSTGIEEDDNISTDATNTMIYFPSNYVAQPTSTKWTFDPYANRVKAGTIPEVVTSTNPSAYPYDGSAAQYYYKMIFSPVPSPSFTTTLTDADLIGGVKYSVDINSSTDIEVGLCASAQINFQTRKTGLATNQVLYYKVRQIDETAFKDVGPFIIQKITKKGEVYNVTAYDFMSKLNVNIATTDLYSGRHTIEEHFNALCSTLGVTGTIGDHCLANDSFYYFNYEWPAETTKVNARDVLSYLAALGGCIALVNNTGTLTFKKYGTTSSYTLDDTKYTSFDYALYQVPVIDKLYISDIIQTEGYESGTGNNPIYITGNKAFHSENISGPDTEVLQGIADAIYTQVHAIPTYTPCNVQTYRDFNINIGDLITVDEMTMLVMQKSWSNSGIVFSCSGNTYRNQLDLRKREQDQLEELTNKVDTAMNFIESGAATTVIANPPSTGTEDTLETIQIDDEVYIITNEARFG